MGRRGSGGQARAVGLALAALVLVAGVACSPRRDVEAEVEEHTEGTFYDVPGSVPEGAPGSLVRSERLLGAPDGSEAWRIVYRSTDQLGAPMVVSGIVVAPTGRAPDGGRPVVAWAHPTTGTAPSCAPSVGIDPFGLIEGLHELLAAGYVIAATDYSNMGTPGPPSYLLGASEGNSVLDSARAARAIPETGAGTELLLWGHSQGGHAALFAAQTAQQYAPELDLRGVAVAAPATDLAQLLDDDITGVSGVTIGAYAFDAYQKVYGSGDEVTGLETVLTPAGAQAVPGMASQCLFGDMKELHAVADPLVGGFLAHDPSTTPPWSVRLGENTPGLAPIAVPVLVAQGLSDTLVHPQVTDDYVRRICGQGEQVEYRRYQDIDHGLVAERAVPLLIPWLADRVAGAPATSTCGEDLATLTTPGTTPGSTPGTEPADTIQG